jgi:hypothetical protein
MDLIGRDAVLSDGVRAPLALDASGVPLYRYALWDVWDPDLPLLTFLMCNPSTADAFEDDATIRKVRGFTGRFHLLRRGPGVPLYEGRGGFVVVNVSPLRSRDPKRLRAALEGGLTDALPRENERWVLAAGMRGPVVCAWGGIFGGFPERPREALRREAARLLDLVRPFHGPPLCLAETASGAPNHPVMLTYETALAVYPPPGRMVA